MTTEPSKQFIGKQNGTEDICCSSPCRSTSKSVLTDMIKRKQIEAENLQTILNMLPTQMTHQQDEALWCFLTTKR